MSGDVLPLLGPDKGECEGNRDQCSVDGCPKFGRLGKPARDGQRRVKGCGDRVALGKRNKRKGQRNQRAAAKAVGVPLGGLGAGHEENWRGAMRIEVKSGAQVGPVWTRYLRARAQSDEAKALGDNRPFVFMAMPDGDRGGLVVVHTDDLADFVQAFIENFGGAA